uniref:UBC core domain-containing protein n=1 Tax=Ananas comosus var. bracteatus TaxID=296719 RepID=A0A6V7PRE0_ANACO|nr:unnamed protein product [Ananas comosus var. bracteatus]
MARENQEGRGNTPPPPPPPPQPSPMLLRIDRAVQLPLLRNSRSMRRGAPTGSRLQSELMALMMCGDPGISAFPRGTTSSAGKGPSTVKFESPCFHPNVDLCGNICLDILQDKWSSAYDVRTILLSVQSLLGEPNNDSPLNTQAAAMWANQEEFRKMVEKHYKLAS